MPGFEVITVTDAARKRVAEIMASNDGAKGIRIGVKNGGCAGMEYTVELVKVDMTLTAPGCPVAGEMPIWVRDAIATVQGVMDVEVELVFDPPWTPDRMSEEAQIALGWY